MNAVRQRILLSIPPYKLFGEHKDLISFCVCSEYFADCEDENNGIEADFDEVIVIVEKDWLFTFMQVKNPLEYLKNEYTSEDSIGWFDEALRMGKVVMVAFN